MLRQRPIALVGLSATEQILLEGALFQPGSNQLPGASQVHDPAHAALVIANADDGVSIRTLQSLDLSGQVLLIGASDAGTGWPLVSRPLRLHAVLEAARRALAPPPSVEAGRKEPLRIGNWLRRAPDAPAGFAATQPFADAADLAGFEVKQQRGTATRPSQPDATPPVGMPEAGDAAAVPPPEPVSAGPSVEAPTLPADAPDDGDVLTAMPPFAGGVPSVAPSGWEQEQAEWEAQSGQAVDPGLQAPASDVSAAPPADRASTDRILVVGPHGVATEGLRRTLKSGGFTADFASSEDAMFQQLAQQPYGFVFLIEVSLGPRAIQLCDAIRNRPNASRESLRIVIVASHRGLFSRIRAWFAGCSAWMAIPLKKTTLLQYLQLHSTRDSTQG